MKKLVPKGLENFIGTFLKGVWWGMGPDVTKGTIPRKEIRKVVRKYPPKRGGI